MNVKACQLHRSARSAAEFPRDGLPEIAFAGRSNVGKSSLLNRLLGVRNLARTSKTPGRTRTINFYRVNDRVYFVDLPGYGYARVSREMREGWRDLVGAYLDRPGLPDLAIHLVDARHDPADTDLDLALWLRSKGVRTRVVLTKFDKLPGQQRARALAEAARRLDLPPDGPPIAVSAETGEGLPALWHAIDDVCAARRSETLAHPR